VQGELEAALATVLRLAELPALTVAGRTDAGVHARGQVAHVDLPPSAVITQTGAADAAGSQPLARLVRSINGVLPDDVRVHQARFAPPGFDARFSALGRRYSYRVCDGPVDPLRRHDTLWHQRPLDIAAMNAASALLLGEHDFAAFCRRREGATTVRGLLAFDWSREDSGVAVARVEADAFCHSMVRSLVGALLAVGDGRRDIGWPASVLAAGGRDSAVLVVAPHGLTLEEVRYPEGEKLAIRAEQTRRRRDIRVVETSATSRHERLSAEADVRPGGSPTR
jgi:tRNA pseudouridine38-40 synthase